MGTTSARAASKIVGHSPENQSIMIAEVTMRRQPEQ